MPGTSVLYIHNCGNDAERAPDSFEGIHENVKLMLDVGAKHIWILFNKQDLLPVERRSFVVDDLRQRFEQEMSRYKEQGIVYQVLDLPGFSAVTGEQVSNLVPAIHKSLGKARKKGRGSTEEKRPESGKMLSKTSTPSEADLISRIEEEGDNEPDAGTFWKAFLLGDIPEWNHRSYLRAGYHILLETLKDGKGIFETADTFLDHLKKLKESKPEHFRNTEHRSTTIFWLYHLQLAILSFKRDKSSEGWPTWDDFHKVLLNSPQLMDGGLWKIYFSKELLFSPEAKEYWRLPDLQALPDLAQTSTSQPKLHVRRNSQEEPYRVMRFAFTVVQKYMSSNIRRGLLVKQALASLQSTTMRLRVKNPSIPPYSETQTYFWIQIIHAALASEVNRVPAISPKEELTLHVPLHHLSFSSFRVLFDMEPTLWKTHYKAKTWESIEARMAFVNPDVKPLPNVINIPSTADIGRAMSKQLDNAKLGMAAELPSMEDLTFRAVVILEDAKGIPDDTTEISGHAHLLLFLYNAIVIKRQRTQPTESMAKTAASVMMRMSGPYITSFTLKSFWTQQVLGATLRDGPAVKNDSADDTPPTFENFLRKNLHLVYDNLPLCYYSPELLQSFEAKDTFVAPDRRRMRAYSESEGNEEDDEWVVL
jgi:hypothetical protein